jgi:acyl-CoA thioesterase FadM
LQVSEAAAERARDGDRHGFSVRIAPRYCDAQGMVHASRYYELFEDAFLAWLEHACGGYPALQATGGDLLIVENGCSYRHPAGQNDTVTIEVDPLWASRSSFCVALRVRRDQIELAEGRSTYVFVQNGASAPIPALLDPALADARARSSGRPRRG